ncbi:hypothetical protein X769_25160 [Mesorhizobium sp. LSJC268A00]|uniref:DUF680 domain-containing protein n=1 Tax=unclassified Mesorhizobium TaxID=325217 RepID=UPI0003CE4D16|nr:MULTISPECIES: DUF680 domain-containing protein [unclassified Mesorhizobium]ESW99170.1 hypothetical protein X769_25160 [Mesorhizobium sp. LSJC268A00]ESZ12761.1 hypothetical protein X735_21835 [Mesorhizobium sp. L2C085B000]
MTKIALTAAAILLATGTAFAGSDHYGSDGVNQPAVTAPAGNIDHRYTASIRKPASLGDFTIKGDSNQPESGQGIWGR